MQQQQETLYTAPAFLGAAFLMFALAIVEKVLNLFGLSIPIVNVFPRQMLDWAVALLMFDIALLLRQMLENKLR